MDGESSLVDTLTRAVPGAGWAPRRRPAEGRMPSLTGATGWLNSPPLTTEGLRGHVVVLDFWTYTCINWLRTAPYLRAWADAYRNAGAVVIGVHTPEFGFEHEVDNVRRAVDDRRVAYPVALDADYAVWTAFANMYWPALYVVDVEGRIRYHHFGEGAYEESEGVVRRLLAEADPSVQLPAPTAVMADGVEAAADWADLGSPENYLGADRTANFASPEGAGSGVPREFTIPRVLHVDDWALSGLWTVDDDAVRLSEPGGRIAVRFVARDVNLVVTAEQSPVRFHLRIDDRPPGGDHGEDVDADGGGRLVEPRLYQLVRLRNPGGEHTVEITFLDPGAAAYAFTFG